MVRPGVGGSLAPAADYVSSGQKTETVRAPLAGTRTAAALGVFLHTVPESVLRDSVLFTVFAYVRFRIPGSRCMRGSHA
jgi:hypothetical protein